MGVASCGAATCHGRQVQGGPDIRYDELKIWQDSSSVTGAHSRAWQVLRGDRAREIGRRLGLPNPERAEACLGCHAEQPAPGQAKTLLHIEDGVGCEACHGGSGGWLSTHYAVGATHADNVARGMTALEDPKVRAAICLDCHYGGAGKGKFVTHQMMSAGHPRLVFELDLFSDLQRHYDIDADYAARKHVAGGAKTWAVGQAVALERALALYSDASHGQAGALPEFYFFDCRSCHRPISDSQKPVLMDEANPSRSLASGFPPFDDENMIVLSAAAARAAAPAAARRFEADSAAFHAAFAKDRAATVLGAQRLAGSTQDLRAALTASPFDRAEIFAILDDLLSGPSLARYTDEQGGAQAMMSVDTLLTALIKSGGVDEGRAARLRPDIEAAYQALKDPNLYHPADFRQKLIKIAMGVRSLR